MRRTAVGGMAVKALAVAVALTAGIWVGVALVPVRHKGVGECGDYLERTARASESQNY